MIVQLQAEMLLKPCIEEIPNFSINDKSNLPDDLIDQKRAEEALKMGLKIKGNGFNVFASGDEGTGKLTAVKMFLQKQVVNEPTPDDWCYVYNFKEPYHPKKIRLPAGLGAELKSDMKTFVSDAMQTLIKTFESEVYTFKRQTIKEKNDKQQSALTLMINEKAEKESLSIKQTPLEVYTVPLKKGEAMTDEEFDNLPLSEKQVIQDKQTKFTTEMNSALKEQRTLEKEMNKENKTLESEVTAYAINELTQDISLKYEMIPDVVQYLDYVKSDILENLTDFMISQKEKLIEMPVLENEYMKRYQINVLVDNTLQKGSPIVIESNPTYNNLMGRVEKESLMGSLITDFTMIRKGTLHEANGGYLIINAADLFKNLFSWEALKRAIGNKEIRIEEISEQLGYLTTKTLKPEPIQLEVKIILVGSPLYYHLLYEHDNDFKSLFKVKADFNSEMDRTPENTANYFSFFQKLSEKENMLVPDKEALRKLEEFGARFTDDQNKLSMRFEKITDVLREANHYATEEGQSFVGATHIENAIEKRIYRSNMISEKINEMIKKKHILIELTGKKTGQVNALSIIDMGDLRIGKPSKITCTINMGKEGVITVEREVELSGPIHTKGVLILNGYLTEHFFQDKPISLTARLVFEQSYAEIDGDSASSTELYALLSALSKAPIQQGIAVTGSVNQKGEIQSIGGINEKIEGYFEVCKIIGLNGEQGIVIPSSNVQNLMLRKEVIDAVKENKFKIWAVDTIDDGIEVLTGIRSGTIEEEGSINWLVNKTISEYSKKLKEFSFEEKIDQKTNSTNHFLSNGVVK